MRKHVLVALGLVAMGSLAQDQDLFIEGVLTDATTGAKLSQGFIDVFNEVDTAFAYSSDCDLEGAFKADMYVWDSSYYVIGFNAPGYVTRRAVIDLTGLNVELDADMAWKITMNVALTPDAGKGTAASADDLLGYATFDNKDKTIRWKGSPAKEKFLVKRVRMARLPSASEKMNELYDKEGTLVSGIIRDHWSEAPIAGVSVIVTTPGGYYEKVTSDQYGVYGVVLPYDRVFDIRFEKDGLVSKHVEFNNKGIPEEDRAAGFRANVDMRLFKPIKGEDFAFLKDPVGKAAYDPTTHMIEWDMAYTRGIMEQLKAVLDKHPGGR